MCTSVLTGAYEWVLTRERLLDEPDKWRGWYGDRPAWVFTHRDLPATPGARLTFVSGAVRPVHEAMVAAAGGRNVWLFGAFADEGLLDEIILGVAPVTLGGGAPLLPRRLPASRLRLTSAEQVGQFAHLRYAVAAPPG
ncbi:dihydrofolate reductase family protein [Micromonospora zhanjiangensis]|uniref:Dihydrofolate reductase family protein n=1 Tax=Micromonospora zhanjiangensis TaxID=1522057 RepID=A0ABV8KVA7_9ACTN